MEQQASQPTRWELFYSTIGIILIFLNIVIICRFVYHIWPRYEEVEEIQEIPETYTFIYPKNAYIKCDNEITYYKYSQEVKNYSCLDAEGKGNGCVSKNGYCYIKYKKRIN